MILDMGNRFGAGAVVLALAFLVGCQTEEETTSAEAIPHVQYHCGLSLFVVPKIIKAWEQDWYGHFKSAVIGPEPLAR